MSKESSEILIASINHKLDLLLSQVAMLQGQKPSKAIEETQDILTAKEASEEFKIKLGTLYQLSHKGTIPKLNRPGKHLYFSRRALLEWYNQKPKTT